MTPSCPVTIALGIRKARKPRIHQPKAVGPALWITAALVMNRTMAAKIATMSNELRTFGRIPPATRSESSSPLAAGSTAAMVVPPPARGGGYQGGGGRGCWTCPNRSPKAGQRLELCPVVEALEGHVLLGERARLGPLHRQVGGAPQRPERVHEQLVPLQRVQRRAQRVGQAPDPAPGPPSGSSSHSEACRWVPLPAWSAIGLGARLAHKPWRQATPRAVSRYHTWLSAARNAGACRIVSSCWPWPSSG